jgi:UDP-glucose 4-epimerase
MSNILITGGAGFIGSNLSKKLISPENNITILDNLSTGIKENVPKEIDLIVGDIRSDLDIILKDKKFDVVYHLAAQISVSNSMNKPKDDADINILGSLNIIEWCIKNNVKKFVFSSSAAVYDSNKTLLKENDKIEPKSPYGLAKRTIEQYLKILGESDKINYCILRFSNVYGPGQNPKSEAGVISIFTDLMIKGEDITIFGDGSQTRDFVYVKDVASALVLAQELEGIYNVSSAKEITINELVSKLNSIIGNKVKIIYEKPRKGDIAKSSLDNSKIINEGWKSNEILEQGLLQTIEYIKHRHT